MDSAYSVSLLEKKNKINIYVGMYLSSILFFFAIGLLSGSNLYALSCLVLVSALAVLPLLSRTVLVSDVIVFAFGLYCGYITIFAKAALFQPLQDNMRFPNSAASAILIGFLAVFFSGIVAKMVIASKRSRISMRLGGENISVRIVILLFSFGLVARFVHKMLNRGGEGTEGGMGWLGAFYPVLLLGIVMIFEYSRKGRIAGKPLLILAIGSMFYLAAFSTAKRDALDLIAAFIIYFFAFGVRFRLIYACLGGLLVAFLLLIVSPIIHIVRSEGLLAAERIPRMAEIISEVGFDPVELASREASFFQGFAFSYAEYASHIYPEVANVDRFSLVFTMDQVMRGVDDTGYMDPSMFVRKLGELVLPSLIIKKDGIASTDLIAWQYGIRSNGSVARPVIGAIPAAYSVGGAVPMVILIFSSCLMLFVPVGYFFGPVKNSAFGVLGCVTFLSIPEKSFEYFLSFAVRDMIMIWAAFSILLFISKFRISFSR